MAKKITIEVTENEAVKRDGDKIIFEIPVDRVKDLFDKKVKLASVPIGETFKIGDEEWIVLEHSGDTTACLRKDLLLVKFKFDDTTNNFSKSYINHFLNVHYKEKLQKLVGNNLCEHTVDLTADDGLKDYKKCKAYVSLLTCEQYRKYTDIMLKYSPKQWWWLATAYSTPTRGYRECVRAVLSDGTLSDNVCYSDGGGVRPFCILKSCCEVVR